MFEKEITRKLTLVTKMIASIGKVVCEARADNRITPGDYHQYLMQLTEASMALQRMQDRLAVAITRQEPVPL